MMSFNIVITVIYIGSQEEARKKCTKKPHSPKGKRVGFRGWGTRAFARNRCGTGILSTCNFRCEHQFIGLPTRTTIELDILPQTFVHRHSTIENHIPYLAHKEVFGHPQGGL
jgi:hypothetical protein